MRAWAAQIAENRIRRDLTFLEYARVFGEVENAEGRARLMSRIGISSAQMSHYTRVIRDIPKETVELLGAARDVGRDQLFRLSDLCRRLGAEEASGLIREAGSTLAEALNEKERFGKIVRMINAGIAKPTKMAAPPAYLSIRSTPARVTVSLDRSVDADFARYKEHRLPILIEAERAEFEKRRMS